MRLGVWTVGSPAHSEEILCYCAGLAIEVDEWRLAGLAAYQAQSLHLARQGDPAQWGLPMLPGLEVAGHQFNLVRHVPLRSRNVILRRLEPEDQPFLLELFGNPRFLSQYSRPAHGCVESRVYQLLENHHPFPKRVGMWNWLVCDAQGRQIGLLEISSLNFYQGSAELALGFKHSRFGTLAAEAYLFAAFIAFHHLDLQILTSQVYADNAHSNQLVVRVKMQREYAVDAMVTDKATGSKVGLTTYAMLRDEFRQWPLARRVAKHLGFTTAPDLLLANADTIAREIVGRGVHWRKFPPLPPTHVDVPAAGTSKPQPFPFQPLPATIEDAHLRLRRPAEQDAATVRAWFHQQGFMKLLPNHWRLDDPDALLADVCLDDPGRQLWLVEPKQSGCAEGIIGIELQNDTPILFLLAGFTDTIKPHHALRALLRLRHTVQEHYRAARIYFKVDDAELIGHGGRPRHNWYRRGTQRHYRPMNSPPTTRCELAVYEWHSAAERRGSG